MLSGIVRVCQLTAGEHTVPVSGGDRTEHPAHQQKVGCGPQLRRRGEERGGVGKDGREKKGGGRELWWLAEQCRRRGEGIWNRRKDELCTCLSLSLSLSLTLTAAFLDISVTMLRPRSCSSNLE